MKLIDADALLEKMKRTNRYFDVKFDIEEMQTIDQESLRPHGRWIEGGYVCGENEYECSVCHETEWRTSASRMKYCMFCGAKMDLE